MLISTVTSNHFHILRFYSEQSARAMGKAWKRRERQAGSPEVPGDYKWSSQSYTLKDILTNFKLPVVVQCREDTNAEHLQVGTYNLNTSLISQGTSWSSG